VSGELRQLDPRIRTVWRVGAAIRSAVIALVLCIAAGSVIATDILGAPPAILLALVLAGAVTAFGWWWPGVTYRHWSYRLGDEAIEVDHGVAFRTHSVIPYFRVQHVDTSQGPIDRRLGLTSLTIHTASAATDATLPGLADADAVSVRSLVLDRAGVGDAV
jgi:membrane protein YdbS with pleckstrin-like domain